jgi:hypothetical protein
MIMGGGKPLVIEAGLARRGQPHQDDDLRHT